MPKIAEIKIIRGRQEETVIANNKLRKVAEVLYEEWKSKYKTTESIEYWAHKSSESGGKFKDLYEPPIEKSAGAQPEKKHEVSIEQQMLDLINAGWETKGEMMISDNVFFLTMVRYEPF